MMILRLALLWVLCSAWQERMKERPVVRREGKGHPRSDLAQKSLLVTAEGETEMEAQQMAPPPNERAAMIEETEFDESEDVASAPEDERDAPPVEETHPRPEPLMGEADWPEPEPSEEKPGAGDDVEPEDAEVPEAAAPPPAAAPVAAAAPSAARPNATEAAPRPTDAVADENEDDDGPVPGDAPDASPDAATADEAEEIQLTELEEDPQDRNPEALTAEVSIIEETVSEEESESQWSDGPDGTDSPEEPDLQGEPLTEEEATSAQPSAAGDATQQPEDDSKDEDPPAEDIPDPTNETEAELGQGESGPAHQSDLEEDFAKLFNFIDAEAASLALENAGACFGRWCGLVNG
ncbi:unnamed protein product [Durusdinium trenchii]|uniref:Uncharacterized protein n=1 Tax=Durusdinium trenchii TaxID=1381693 RepID=A0ABP0INR2_9DINO